MSFEYVEVIIIIIIIIIITLIYYTPKCHYEGRFAGVESGVTSNSLKST